MTRKSKATKQSKSKYSSPSPVSIVDTQGIRVVDGKQGEAPDIYLRINGQLVKLARIEEE
jgi:hypothetical protein